MTTYGYARVSTNGQDLGSQEAELMAAGIMNPAPTKSVGRSAPCTRVKSADDAQRTTTVQPPWLRCRID